MNHIYEQPQFGEVWFSFQTFYSDMVKKFNSGSHFVEIGSWKGKSSAYMAVEIMNSQKSIQFDCIDTWKGSPEHTDDHYIKNDTLYELFTNNMKPVENFYKSIRMDSKKACELYADKSLDFVFIDAEHSYESVLADIKCWEPKVKSGGIIGGHDYPTWDGVTRAVNEYYGDRVKPAHLFCWSVEL